MADTPVLWKKRGVLLREVGERFDVSRERIRQIKVGVVARRLDDAYVRWPQPRLRAAAVLEDLPEDGRSRLRSNACRVTLDRDHAELNRRGISRSPEATRHASAALGAISYARGELGLP